MKIKIVKLFRSDKNKDGKPLITKDGRTYSKIAIQTDEYQGRWISGFVNQENASWKVGDEVNIKIEEVATSTGNIYLNFKGVDRVDMLEERIKTLEDFVKNV